MSESSVKSESENGSFARDALLPFLVGLSRQSRQSRAVHKKLGSLGAIFTALLRNPNV